jgi:hypothetical protein
MYTNALMALASLATMPVLQCSWPGTFHSRPGGTPRGHVPHEGEIGYPPRRFRIPSRFWKE